MCSCLESYLHVKFLLSIQNLMIQTVIFFFMIKIHTFIVMVTMTWIGCRPPSQPSRNRPQSSGNWSNLGQWTYLMLSFPAWPNHIIKTFILRTLRGWVLWYVPPLPSRYIITTLENLCWRARKLSICLHNSTYQYVIWIHSFNITLRGKWWDAFDCIDWLQDFRLHAKIHLYLHLNYHRRVYKLISIL